MGLLITSIILTIIVFIILGIRCDTTKDEVSYKIGARNFLALFCLLIICFGMFKTIKPNNVGIIYNRFKGRNSRYFINRGVC